MSSEDRHRIAHDELDVLIRARYPVIYVVTWEEKRVLEHLQRIAEKRGKELYTWSVVNGLVRAGTSSPRARGGGDPIEDLNTVIEHKEPAIYCFHDLHMFLHGASPTDRPIARKVREVAKSLSDSYKSLVITAPSLRAIPELEKDLTVYDYPLPSVVELDELLERITTDVKAGGIIVDLKGAARESLIQAAGGLTLQEAENVFAKTIVMDGRLSADDVSTVFAEKKQIVRKSGLLEYYTSDDTLESVGGLDQLKDWLRRRSTAFSKEATAYGLPSPRGVLLVGIQGCGKSMCAKAVSREWNMPLLRLDVGRMFQSYIGSSEENIRRCIAVAESVAPAVLWIDEIDKAFSGAQSSGRTDGGTTARVMSTFLTWLNEKTKPVFVVATANDISQLPPEMLRKGRLDEIFFVDLPSGPERGVITAIHLLRRKRDPKQFDLDAIGAATDGFSGAEIEQAIISALFDAFYDNRQLETSDVLKSARETVPLSRTMIEKISSLREWASGRARYASTTVINPGAAPAMRRKIEV